MNMYSMRKKRDDTESVASAPAGLTQRTHAKTEFGDVFHGTSSLAIRVDDIYKWLDFLCVMDSQAEKEGRVAGHHRFPRKWVYRGQANAEWNIKSSFEVLLAEGGQTGGKQESFLREKERRAFLEFRRFGYAHLHGLPEMNFPEWLTYMQHFGVKTRMVDFTESPLTALYFSQEDKQQEGDFAVWGVCISALSPFSEMPEFKAIQNCDVAEKWQKMDALVQCLFKDQACTSNNMARQWSAACKVFEYDGDTFEIDPQIFYFYPRWHNSRSSAQSGLFLMPSHLSMPFHEILMLGSSNQLDSEFKLDDVLQHEMKPDQIAAHLRVVKFIFNANLRGKVKQLLKLMDKNPRTIYPDIQGLARSLESPLEIK